MDNDEIINIISKTFRLELDFLSNIYGITSYDDGINYLKNNDNLQPLTIMRILNCLYKIFIEEDYFPSTEYINILYDSYFNIYNVKLKKSGLKNIIINNKYNKKDVTINRLIKNNYKNIIEE